MCQIIQELTQLTLRLEDATDDAKSSRSQLEHQLELEMNRRSELEGRNKALEEETAKASPIFLMLCIYDS